MPDAGIQVCPVCGVKIMKVIGGDRVLFSVGPPATRAVLWTRVCQYTQQSGCINQDQGAASLAKPEDYYQ